MIHMQVYHHYHENEDELFYVVEGKAEFIVDGKPFIAREGDTIYGPRRVPHGYRFIKPTKMVVTICPSGFERMFKEVHNMEDQSNLEEVIGVFNSKR